MHHAAPVMVVSGAEVYSFAYSCIPVYSVHALSRAHCRRYTVYSLQVYSAYRYTSPTPPSALETLGLSRAPACPNVKGSAPTPVLVFPFVMAISRDFE